MKNEKQKNTNEKRLSRKTIISLVAVVLVFAAVSVAMIPLIRLLSSEHGQEIIIEKMQSFGIFAPLLFVLLQVLQVVVAVIPGGPVPIIGGILFGQWGGLFLSLAGFFLGTVLVYYLVQWIGRPLVDRFVPESHFKKFDFLLEGKRTELLIFLVFLLPGLPKDALTYLVSFNPRIKPLYLFILTTLGRTPATVLTVFMGKSLWEGNFTLEIVLAAIIVVLAVAGIFIKRKVDKRAERKHKLHENTSENQENI